MSLDRRDRPILARSCLQGTHETKAKPKQTNPSPTGSNPKPQTEQHRVGGAQLPEGIITERAVQRGLNTAETRYVRRANLRFFGSDGTQWEANFTARIEVFMHEGFNASRKGEGKENTSGKSKKDDAKKQSSKRMPNEFHFVLLVLHIVPISDDKQTGCTPLNEVKHSRAMACSQCTA